MDYECYKSLFKLWNAFQKINQMLLLLGVYEHAFTFHFLHWILFIISDR